MKKAIVGGLDQFLPHPDIRVEFAHLYHLDGVHMLDVGNDVFLEDLQTGCKQYCAARWGTSQNRGLAFVVAG